MEKVEKIKNAFIESCLEEGRYPVSVFSFMKKLKLKEGDFYEHFNSFESLESQIWNGFLNDTIKKITSDEIYITYSSREKMLYFYYTLIEVLQQNRSYVSHTWLQIDKKKLRTPSFLQAFKSDFGTYINQLVGEAKESREVKARKYLDSRYPDALWLQLLMVIEFWIKDPSNKFERTDAFIEKAVNTSFELMGSSALDSVLDLAKFLYQQHR
jgi:Tetracyclin repressor-like, C-terminal domain